MLTPRCARCSSLVLYYLRPSGPWTNCVRHLILSLNQGSLVPSNALDYEPSSAARVPSLSSSSTLAVLWFASYLVQEVGEAMFIVIFLPFILFSGSQDRFGGGIVDSYLKPTPDMCLATRSLCSKGVMLIRKCA